MMIEDDVLVAKEIFPEQGVPWFRMDRTQVSMGEVF